MLTERKKGHNKLIVIIYFFLLKNIGIKIYMIMSDGTQFNKCPYIRIASMLHLVLEKS